MTHGYASPISIINSGDIAATSISDAAAGISALTTCCYAPITIANSGDLTANGFGNAWGIQADAGGPHSAIAIENNGM